MEFVLRLACTRMSTTHQQMFVLVKVIAQCRLRTLSFLNVIEKRKDGRMSFKLPAVPRQNHVEWSDCRRNRQERRQSNMLLLSHGSTKSKAVPNRKSWEPDVVLYVHYKWHTDTAFVNDLVEAEDMGKSCRTRSDYLV